MVSRACQLCEETNGTLWLEGLEHYLGRDRTSGLRRGVALNPGLAHYVTERKTKETEVMQQRWKAREEAEAAKKAKGGGKKTNEKEHQGEKAAPRRPPAAARATERSRGQFIVGVLQSVEAMASGLWLALGRKFSTRAARRSPGVRISAFVGG